VPNTVDREKAQELSASTCLSRGAYFGEADQLFRSKLIIEFAPRRSLISLEGDHVLG
jgi:hypothetical protein